MGLLWWVSPKTVEKPNPILATSVIHLGLKVSPISGTNGDPLCARGVIRSAALSDLNCATGFTYPGHVREPIWARGVGDFPLPPHYIMWGQQPSGPPPFSQISLDLGLCPSGQGRRRAATAAAAAVATLTDNDRTEPPRRPRPRRFQRLIDHTHPRFPRHGAPKLVTQAHGSR